MYFVLLCVDCCDEGGLGDFLFFFFLVVVCFCGMFWMECLRFFVLCEYVYFVYFGLVYWLDVLW